MSKTPKKNAILSIQQSENVASTASLKAKSHLNTDKSGDNGNNKQNLPLKKIDVVKACKMRFTDHKTLAEIGTHFEISPQAVDQALQRFISIFGDPEEIRIFNDNRAVAWTNMEKIGIDGVVDKKDDMSVSEARQLATAAHGIGRLEADKTTAITEYRNLAPELQIVVLKNIADSKKLWIQEAYDAEAEIESEGE